MRYGELLDKVGKLCLHLRTLEDCLQRQNDALEGPVAEESCFDYVVKQNAIANEKLLDAKMIALEIAEDITTWRVAKLANRSAPV